SPPPRGCGARRSARAIRRLRAGSWLDRPTRPEVSAAAGIRPHPQGSHPHLRPADYERVSDSSPPRPLVLVAEDDHDIRTLIAHRLKAGGCDVVTAEDGERALNLVEQTQPDLLLLDVSMPGIDGFAVCREVAKLGPAAPPVIFLTAHGNVFSRVTGLEAGAV